MWLIYFTVMSAELTPVCYVVFLSRRRQDWKWSPFSVVPSPVSTGQRKLNIFLAFRILPGKKGDLHLLLCFRGNHFQQQKNRPKQGRYRSFSNFNIVKKAWIMKERCVLAYQYQISTITVDFVKGVRSTGYNIIIVWGSVWVFRSQVDINSWWEILMQRPDLWFVQTSIEEWG